MEITNEGIEWLKKKKSEMNRMPIISGSILLMLFVIILSFLDKNSNYIGFYLPGFIIGTIFGGKIMMLMICQELQTKKEIEEKTE